MTPIQFGVSDCKGKKMYPAQLLFYGLAGKISRINPFCDDPLFVLDANHAVLMQYLGFPDKNGVEICGEANNGAKKGKESKKSKKRGK